MASISPTPYRSISLATATCSTSISQAGTASSYRVTAPMTTDGRWSFAPDGTAHRTAHESWSVSRPTAAKFSGTVVVEWLNVSGGVDADPEWASLAQQITRQGDVWVGVSAQTIGVMGGPVLVKVNVPGSQDAGKGLRAIDPARYGSLQLPGDGSRSTSTRRWRRALRPGLALGGLRPDTLIAAGESQSAFALVTYYNGVQPLTHAFDGFFVHSRGAAGLPLAGPGAIRRPRRDRSADAHDLPDRSECARDGRAERDRRHEHSRLLCRTSARQ